MAISGRTVTTVLEEKRFNPRLTRSKDEFIQIMKTLNLAYMKGNGNLNFEIMNMISPFYSKLLRIHY